jgi:hypothetical protein
MILIPRGLRKPAIKPLEINDSAHYFQGRVLVGLRYKGEAVFQTYSATKTTCYFFSQEVKRFTNGTCKFVRWVPLSELKIDQRLSPKHKACKVKFAIEALKLVPGMKLD